MMEVIEFCISPGAVDVGDSLIGVLPDFLSFSQSLSSPVSLITGTDPPLLFSRQMTVAARAMESLLQAHGKEEFGFLNSPKSRTLNCVGHLELTPVARKLKKKISEC